MADALLKHQVGDIVIKDGKTWLVLATKEHPYGFTVREGYDYIIENEVTQEAALAKESEIAPHLPSIGNRDGAGDMHA